MFPRLLLLLLLAASAPAPAAEESGALSFRQQNGFILVAAHPVGSREPLTLLLDSGASASVLDLHTAQRLNLPLGRAETVRGVDARARAYHLAPLVPASDAIVFSPMIMAVDLSNAGALCGERIDGLIGADFFARGAVQIDFASRRLSLVPTSAAQAGECRLPLVAVNGVFCVPVRVNGSGDRWVRLDTGCNDPLHWVVPRLREHARRGTSLGFVSDSCNMTRALVQLGAWTVPDVETSLHGHPLFPNEAGLLGTGLLARYLITIDAPHRELTLRQPR